jgi:hypothetical protein
MSEEIILAKVSTNPISFYPKAEESDLQSDASKKAERIKMEVKERYSYDPTPGNRFLYWMILGETPEETQTRNVEVAKSEKARLDKEQAYDKKMRSRLEPLIETEKSKISVMLREGTLIHKNGKYFYNNIEVDIKSVRDIIKIWEELAVKLVKYNLVDELRKAAKLNEKAKVAELMEQIKFLVEKTEKGVFNPHISCDRITDEIKRLIFSGGLFDGEGSVIKYEKKSISSIIVVYSKKEKEEIVCIPETSKPGRTINADYFKDDKPSLPVITRKDILSGRVRVDKKLNFYLDGKAIGKYEGYMWNHQVFDLRGNDVAFLVNPPAPYNSINSLSGERMLSASFLQEDEDKPEEDYGVFKGKDEEGLAGIEYYNFEDSKNIIGTDALLRSNYDLNLRGDIGVIFNNVNEPIAFCHSNIGFVRDKNGNIIYKIEGIATEDKYEVKDDDGNVIGVEKRVKWGIPPEYDEHIR